MSEEHICSQQRKIAALGIADLFDALVISGEIGIDKPDRRIFDHDARLLGVSCDQCVFVGDGPTADISGALGAGMEAVWLDVWKCNGELADDPRVTRVGSVLEYFSF